MSTEEEILRKLEEWKKQREKDYIEFKGMLKGIRLGKLSPIEESFVKLLEMINEGFNNVFDHLTVGYELEITTIQRVKTLEKRMGELETNILQIRETLDELFQAR